MGYAMSMEKGKVPLRRSLGACPPVAGYERQHGETSLKGIIIGMI
jgi:hypothetical protein